jgi:hypothetical protein
VKQGIFKRKLCLFQDVILVKWKEFSKHRCYEFCKSNKKGFLRRKPLFKKLILV